MGTSIDEMIRKMHEDTGCCSGPGIGILSYEALVQMGESAIPALLLDLYLVPNFQDMFILLAICKDASPSILEEDEGKIGPLTYRWLEWGRENGYLPTFLSRGEGS